MGDLGISLTRLPMVCRKAQNGEIRTLMVQEFQRYECRDRLCYRHAHLHSVPQQITALSFRALTLVSMRLVLLILVWGESLAVSKTAQGTCEKRSSLLVKVETR